jgi:hypothetical protein
MDAPLFLPAFPRYNQSVLRSRLHTGLGLCLLLAGSALWASSCAAPLGPGYVVEKQEINVRFDPAAPAIHIDAEYHLRNTGDQPMRDLEILLPGGRRLHRGATSTQWDGADVPAEPSTAHARGTIVKFARAWTISAEHSLRISYEILPPEDGTTGLNFAPDAFYLPAAGWSPELPQARGLFGFGGVPPKKWELVITVPQGFLVHSSGVVKKSPQASPAAQTIHALQSTDDHYPFVVAGRFVPTEITTAHQKIVLWSRTPRDASDVRQASGQLARTVDAYSSVFGERTDRVPKFWIVECPALAGCFSRLRPDVTTFLDKQENSPSAELVSSDTVMVDFSAGTLNLAAAIGPSLAASFLGYGRNPGFYEQTPPLSLLPIFAAATSREQIDGPQVRGDTIRRALRFVPENTRDRTSDDPRAARAKSFLFFYALEDRFGRQHFHDAMNHLLHARASRGFDLDDLIAALEQECHENVAAFVRLWLKHPGVPADFRARYQNASSASSSPTGPLQTPYTGNAEGDPP